MWVERITHVLFKGEVALPTLLAWVKAATPAFDREVNDACVSAWRLRNGNTLLEVVAAEAHRRNAGDKLVVSSDPRWADVADAFAVRVASLAAAQGCTATVIDRHTTPNDWVVLTVGAEPKGVLMQPPGPPQGGRTLQTGMWVDDETSEEVARSILQPLVGRSLYGADDYARWWTEGDRSKLQVVMVPHSIVRRGRTLGAPQPASQEAAMGPWARLVSWVARA